MALKVKAVERLLKFTNNENDPGVYRYVLKPTSTPASRRRRSSRRQPFEAA